ncbi:unnamed protein product, partial [Cuscuta epithymum]
MSIILWNCRGLGNPASVQSMLQCMVPALGTGNEQTGCDEGTSKEEYRSAARPPPKPPPWIDLNVEVWKMKVQEVWSICQLFYFCWSYFRVMFVHGVLFLVEVFNFESLIMIVNSASYYVIRRIYMASDCCFTPAWWLAICIALSWVIVSESSHRVDCDSWLMIVFVRIGLFE